MTLDDLLILLDRSPVVADIHPVSLCYLPDDVNVFDSINDVIEQIDLPQTMPPRRIIITGRQMDSRFPRVNVQHDPFTPAINDILCEHFEQIETRTLRQSQIGDEIVKVARDLDLIILFLVDGLSYENVQGWAGDLTPCLVDVPSVTRLAFPNLVGRPTIAQRLFDVGYSSAIGFSYWTRENNKLTDELFHTIPSVHKFGKFSTILTTLQKDLPRKKTFVQIIRTGLDGYAHHQKRRPPINAIISEVEAEWAQLIQYCKQSGRRAGVFLSADHGILWRDQFEPQIVGTAPATQSARYATWREAGFHSGGEHVFHVNNELYHCLTTPNLRRSLRIDEQGVHGGISYQESIIPFLQLKVSP